MNRTFLQLLTEDRLKDAGVLLANGRYGAAYHHAGYTVEWALKACIAKLAKAASAVRAGLSLKLPRGEGSNFKPLATHPRRKMI